MNIKEYVASRVRGWFPKEPNLPSNHVKAAQATTKAYKVLWYAVVFAFLTLIIAAVTLFYISFLAESLVNRTIVLVIYALVAFALYRAYGRDYYKNHLKEHRLRIMLVSDKFSFNGLEDGQIEVYFKNLRCYTV